jgi:hypothetical protein
LVYTVVVDDQSCGDWPSFLDATTTRIAALATTWLASPRCVGAELRELAYVIHLLTCHTIPVKTRIIVYVVC